MTCAECHELLGGHVLGALEPGESAAMREHLDACPACAEEAARLAPVPGLLSLAGPSDTPLETPPAELEDAILARHARERRPRRRRRWPRLALPVGGAFPRRFGLAVAGIAAAAAIAFAVSTLADLGDQSPAAGVYSASLHGLAAQPAAAARATLVERPVGTVVQLRVHGLSPHRVYELWCVADNGQRITAGTFRADGRGGAQVRLTSAARLEEYRHLRISRRAADRPYGYGTDVMAGLISRT